MSYRMRDSINSIWKGSGQVVHSRDSMYVKASYHTMLALTPAQCQSQLHLSSCFFSEIAQLQSFYKEEAPSSAAHLQGKSTRSHEPL